MEEPFDSLLSMQSGWHKMLYCLLLLHCRNSKFNIVCFKQETPVCCRRPSLIQARSDCFAMATNGENCGGVLTLMRVSRNMNEVK